jgi:Tfp pilus assembly protein PilN
VVRLAIVLWSVGGLLLALNGYFYWKSLSGFDDTRDQLATVEEEIQQEEAEVAALESRIRGSRLDQQNEEVAFLNQKIAERTFEWGRLFDRLAEVLPTGVRLYDLNPVKEQRRDRGVSLARTSDRQRRVRLQILGAAESSDDLLDLLDVLFAADMFEDPTLTQESPEANLIRFRLNVSYIPDRAGEVDRVASVTGSEEASEIVPEEGVEEAMSGELVTPPAAGIAVAQEEGENQVPQENAAPIQRRSAAPARAETRAASAGVERRSTVSRASGRNDVDTLLERSQSRRVQDRLEEEKETDQARNQITGGSGPVPLGNTASSARRF